MYSPFFNELINKLGLREGPRSFSITEWIYPVWNFQFSRNQFCCAHK